MGLVQRPRLLRGLVVAEHALVDRLQQQPGRDGVERRVVLDVLERDLDDRLVELLGGDPVEERELQLGRDLRDPRDVRVEARAGVLDGEVDLVRVVRLPLAVALDHRDTHDVSFSCARSAVPRWRVTGPR